MDMSKINNFMRILDPLKVQKSVLKDFIFNPTCFQISTVAFLNINENFINDKKYKKMYSSK